MIFPQLCKRLPEGIPQLKVLSSCHLHYYITNTILLHYYCISSILVVSKQFTVVVYIHIQQLLINHALSLYIYINNYWISVLTNYSIINYIYTTVVNLYIYTVVTITIYHPHSQRAPDGSIERQPLRDWRSRHFRPLRSPHRWHLGGE